MSVESLIEALRQLPPDMRVAIDLRGRSCFVQSLELLSHPDTGYYAALRPIAAPPVAYSYN